MLDIQADHGQAKFICAQMYYSLLGRDLEHEVAPQRIIGLPSLACLQR